MKRLVLLVCLLLTAVSGLFAVNFPAPINLNGDRRYPYDLIGQLLFFSGTTQYVGSGTVVRASSVLTAGHNVFDPVAGWSTDVEFRRGNYGAQVIASQVATHLYLLAGYQSAVLTYGPDDVRAFAFDTAGLSFPQPLAAGAFIPTSTNPALLTTSYLQIAVGYGAEGQHTGDYPLFVEPFRAYHSTEGSFYENISLYFEGGMSGGPNLTYTPRLKAFYISGVIVSGAANPYAGGIHIMDAAATLFISTYLR